MAFIDKKNPVVLNIKLTSKGRELLSEGKLDFKYYAMGDSEIDYNFYGETNYDPFYSSVLRPADKNPNIISFITREISGETLNEINNVPSTPSIVENTVQPLGFFDINESEVNFITDTNHVKQPDIKIEIDEVTGSTTLNLYKSSTYLANVNEPSVGDFLVVRWTNKNDLDGGVTGYTININKPTPIIIYKIQGIISGTLANDDLVVEVDRNLPDFSVITGGSSNIIASALVYYNYSDFTGSTIYNDSSTDYLNESVLTFLENCQCSYDNFPFWNMSIIFTDEIIGVQEDNKKYNTFNTKKYGGFVSYIQNQAPVLKKLGVIHYSNVSPANTYGEELYVDIPDEKIPVLDLPTLMWHKSSGNTLGLKLKASGSLIILTGETKSLNTNYYDLVDYVGNVVGKVFTDLKLFVIEDQELIFAMSYKSNRSWTLPNYTVGLNDNVTLGCATCEIDFDMVVTNPTTISSNDGTIYINNIINQTSGSQLILTVSGQTSGQVYFNTITTDVLITGLSADTYFVIINDMGALNCQGQFVTLTIPSSSMGVYDYEATQSGLDPDFNLTITNPTTIGVDISDVGTVYGATPSPYIGIMDYGDMSAVSYSSLGTYKEFNLTFEAAYTIYIKDVTTGGDFIVSKNYVAAGNPLNSGFSISNEQTGVNGTYVLVSNYLVSINSGVNPIVGDIEFTIYSTSSYPTTWETLPTGEAVGSSMKLYFNGNDTYEVKVRERQGTIEMYEISKSIIIS